MSITWNTGAAAMRARHNLKLKLKKKIQPEVEATSRKRQATSLTNILLTESGGEWA